MLEDPSHANPSGPGIRAVPSRPTRDRGSLAALPIAETTLGGAVRDPLSVLRHPVGPAGSSEGIAATVGMVPYRDAEPAAEAARTDRVPAARRAGEPGGMRQPPDPARQERRTGAVSRWVVARGVKGAEE
jgi:hypothetical protein